MNREIEKIKQHFKQALDITIDKEYELIQLNVHERSFVHKVGCVFQTLIDWDPLFNKQNYKVDVEYNRHGSNPKNIKVNEEEQKRFPDLIVHQRKRDDFNLLVVEFKKYGNSNDDINKIKKMINDNELHYKIGAFVDIKKHCNNHNAIQWFGEIK